MIVQRINTQTKKKINNPFEISDSDYNVYLKSVENNQDVAYFLEKVKVVIEKKEVSDVKPEYSKGKTIGLEDENKKKVGRPSKDLKKN